MLRLWSSHWLKCGMYLRRGHAGVCVDRRPIRAVHEHELLPLEYALLLFEENALLHQLLDLWVNRKLGYLVSVLRIGGTVVDKPEGGIDWREGGVFVGEVISHALVGSNMFVLEDVARSVDEDLEFLVVLLVGDVTSLRM